MGRDTAAEASTPRPGTTASNPRPQNQSMQSLPSALAIAVYAAATAVLSMHARAAVHALPGPSTVTVRWTWLAAVLLHGLGLSLTLVSAQGLDLGFFNALSTVGWLMAVLLLITTLRRPLENLGLVILPLAALGIALQLAFADGRPRPEELGAGLELHIFVSLLAYSLLSLAALQAVVLAVQNRHLHNHHPGGLVRALPPLQHMEVLLFQMIALGFALLSAALASGFVYLDDIFAQHVVHKTVLSITAWVLFGVLLFGRWRFGWRGRVAIRWTLGGFVALMLAFFGTKLVLELLLQR